MRDAQQIRAFLLTTLQNTGREALVWMGRNSARRARRPSDKYASPVNSCASLPSEGMCKVDLSEEGQIGAVLGSAEDTDVTGRPVRRSARRRSQHVANRPSSVYSETDSTDSVAVPRRAAKRRKRARESDTAVQVKVEEGGSDDATEGDASVFPHLSLTLHGLAADKVTFYGLVQEILAPDVFGMTVVCILLNQTTGRAAVPVFYNLMETYPTPRALACAQFEHLRDMLQPIGLHNIRAQRLIDFATRWTEKPPRWGVTYPSRVSLVKGVAGAWRRKIGALEDDLQLKCEVPTADATEPTASKTVAQRNVYPPTEISHLPGVGRYALDSFLLFKPCVDPVVEMAAVQVDLLGQDVAKPTSERWQGILHKREEMGEPRDVGQLLPIISDSIEKQEAEQEPSPPQPLEPDVWRHLLPLDKELRAYLAWRLTRDDKKG